MYPLISGDDWEFPFNQLRLRTWRDTARYMYEGMKDQGIGLPMLIELTFERWENAKKRPNFKAEDFIHKNSTQAFECRRARRRNSTEIFESGNRSAWSSAISAIPASSPVPG